LRQSQIIVTPFRGTNQLVAGNHALGRFQIVGTCVQPSAALRKMPRTESQLAYFDRIQEAVARLENKRLREVAIFGAPIKNCFNAQRVPYYSRSRHSFEYSDGSCHAPAI
jgi:hypothetical protein